jgi:uncharacterized glyoxalase superfamily protein PhnB
MTGFQPAIPILRSFDEKMARAFYIDFLGFTVQFEHRFGPGVPLYMGIERDGCVLHLSEHFGDGTPGTFIRIEVPDVHAYAKALNAKTYKNARPGVQPQEWGHDDMSIRDPAGNNLIFCTLRNE